MSYDNPWMFKGEIFDSEHINGAHGFVYLIEEKSTGRMYIGQKHLWTTKTRMVDKKKKKIKCESDWKAYYSSSSYIMNTVKENGGCDFNRYIIALCSSDGVLNYTELKLQILSNSFEDIDRFINGFVGGKISRSHIGKGKILSYDQERLDTIIPKTPDLTFFEKLLVSST